MINRLTIEISDEDLSRIKKQADMEEMTVENFIATAALRYVDQNELVSEFELARLLEEENLLD